ncbi:ATP-binding protein [Parafilimonas sp.]|uniref:hybrid sensor histidine kinase/response regulator n=1 Tax=Parafilimonas sp. TaxID=1969739 RepID=UPI0039E4707E
MTNNINVLIIDDDEDDYFITSDYLKNITGKNFIIEWCYNYNNALDEIKRGKYDIFLVDYRLGAKSGIDLIKEVVQLESDVPFILLTGKGDINIDEEAMKLGAFDYLEKGELNSEKLERSIRYSIDRAKTLNELKAKEKKYRNIFDKSGDAIFVTDATLCFSEINAAFSHMLCCEETALFKVKLTELLTDKRLSGKLAEDLKQKGFIENWQTEIRYKKNKPVACIISATKEKDADGKAYYQGVINDISFIKQAERANLRAEKLAATGRLVRTLAHEVRNPINNINLACEHLRSTDASEENALYFDIIYRNSNRINELIKELLNSSRPAEMQLKDAVLQSVIDEIIHSAKDRISLKNIAVQVESPSELINIYVDFDKIVIALLNILINAVEAIEHDKGRISITVKNDSTNAVIEIADNGLGISEDKLPRLFEPYYTSKRNGIGLGLASTLNIIQAHNGSIEVTSEPGKSTTFVITLPIHNRPL